MMKNAAKIIEQKKATCLEEGVEQIKLEIFDVYVDGLCKSVEKEYLKKVFNEICEDVKVRLPKYYKSSRKKEFGFVTFETVEEAKKSFPGRRNPNVRGKSFIVSSVYDDNTLIMNNICTSWTEESFKKKMRENRIAR